MHTKKSLGCQRGNNPLPSCWVALNVLILELAIHTEPLRRERGGGGQEKATTLGTKFVVHVMYL